MAIERWPFWIPLGFNLAWAGLALFLSFSFVQKAARRKLDIFFYLLVASAIGHGALALGQTWWNRDDGVWITFGMWLITALSIPLSAAHFAASISAYKKVAWKAFWAAMPISVPMLFIALTPSLLKDNAYNALIMWVVVMFAAIAGNAIFWGLILSGYLFSDRRNKRQEQEQQQQLTAETDVTRTELRTNMSSVLLQAVMGLCLLFVYCGYGLLVTLGPEGFQEYSGSMDDKNNLQIKLYVFLMNILLYQVVMTLIHFFVNVDGGNNAIAFSLLSRETGASAYLAISVQANAAQMQQQYTYTPTQPAAAAAAAQSPGGMKLGF